MILVTVAAALVAAIGIRQFSDILGPLMLALVFTVTVAPLRRVLLRRGAPKVVAMLATVVVVYLVLAAFALAAVAVAAHFATMVIDYADEFNAILADWLRALSSLGVDQDRLEDLAGSVDVNRAVEIVVGVIGGLTGILGSFLFIVVLLFFTVVDAGPFADNLAGISGAGSRMRDAFTSFADNTFSYMLVATAFGAIVALVDVGVLLLLGVPDAWIWGILAFLTNYVPNVGFVLGVIPPAFVALVEKGPGTALAVVAAYCVVNFVIQMIVQPRVVGRQVGLSASLTFLSLLWWTAIFGGVGAIIAVPMTILVKAVLVDHDPERAWLRPLLESGGDDPPPVSDDDADTDPDVQAHSDAVKE